MGKAKWSILETVATKFIRAKSREPTFWLDKTCIDQANIADGLRILPVIVMSASRMLVLWGESYPSRLWCVWEIFTTLAFTSMAAVTERFELHPLQPGAVVADLGVQLSSFDVRAAQCYNPNDQHRLGRVIHALGTDHFNKRVRLLGQEITNRARGGVQLLQQLLEATPW